MYERCWHILCTFPIFSKIVSFTHHYLIQPNWSQKTNLVHKDSLLVQVNTYQRVVIQGQASDLGLIEAGVPQGSVWVLYCF